MLVVLRPSQEKCQPRRGWLRLFPSARKFVSRPRQVPGTDRMPARGGLPGGQLAEAAAAEDVVPELGRDHTRQRHVVDETGGRDPWEANLPAALASHGRGVEIAG